MPTLPPLLTPRRASPSTLPQDDAFEGYRLSKDLLPDDACETFAIDPPALDAAPASASTDRVAQLASARRNLLVQLHALPDADATRFAFADASGGFTSVDVTHDLNTRTRVAPLTPPLPPAPPRPAPAPGAREPPSLGPSVAAFRLPAVAAAASAASSRSSPVALVASRGEGDLAVGRAIGPDGWSWTSIPGGVRFDDPDGTDPDGTARPRPFVIEAAASADASPGSCSFSFLAWTASSVDGDVRLYLISNASADGCACPKPRLVARGPSPPLWCAPFVARAPSGDDETSFAAAMETLSSADDATREWRAEDDVDAAANAEATGRLVAFGGAGLGARVSAADIRRALDDDDDDDDEGNPFDAGARGDDARLEVFAVRTVAGDMNRREIATFPHDTARARVFAPSPSPPGDPARAGAVVGRVGARRGTHALVFDVDVDDAFADGPLATHVASVPAFSYVARGKPDRKFVLATRDGTCGAVVESGDAAFVYRAPVGGGVGRHQMVAAPLREGEGGAVGACLVSNEGVGTAGGSAKLVVLRRGSVTARGVRAATAE